MAGKSLEVFLLPLEKKNIKKRKEFAPIGSTFFPFRVDSFSEGTWYVGNRKSQRLSPLIRPRGYKTFFMLSSTEHEFFHADKSLITENFILFLAEHN